MSMDVSRMPKLGFGLMRLPHKNGEVDHAQVRNMVDAYMKAGFNYFDTAYVYDGGRSETAIREALVKRYPRDSFFLTDKLPGWMLKSEADRDRIYAEELERCGVEYFDVCLLHSLEEGINYDNTEKYDCFEWLKRQKENGHSDSQHTEKQNQHAVVPRNPLINLLVLVPYPKLGIFSECKEMTQILPSKAKEEKKEQNLGCQIEQPLQNLTSSHAAESHDQA